MAQILFNIGAAKYARAVTAIAARNGYQATIPDPANPSGPQIANPQTKELFLEQWVKDEIRRETRQYEDRQASLTAQATITDIDFN